jgi:hypothetical protein
MTEIEDIKTDLREVRNMTQTNCENIAKIAGKVDGLKAVNDVIPMLIKWVIAPVLSIIAAAFGVSQIIGG